MNQTENEKMLEMLKRRCEKMATQETRRSFSKECASVGVISVVLCVVDWRLGALVPQWELWPVVHRFLYGIYSVALSITTGGAALLAYLHIRDKIPKNKKWPLEVVQWITMLAGGIGIGISSQLTNEGRWELCILIVLTIISFLVSLYLCLRADELLEKEEARAADLIEEEKNKM